MKTTKSGRKTISSRVVSLALLALCITLLIACGENLMVIDFLDGKNSKPLPDVTVTAPTFAAVTEGYTQPAAQKIVITNDGKSKVTVKSVTVSPDTAFTIGGGGSTVNKKSSIDTWTVQPKAALPHGERMAIITVTCSGTGGTAASNTVVTFTVTQPGAANLSVTAPTFAAVTEGYATRPTAESITITNNGSSPATINGVVVSTGSFEISAGTYTVNAASSITDWTVQPKLGLTHDTYMAIITVMYDGGAAASAVVTFVVARGILAITAPTFTDVAEGYTSQPAAGSIKVTNTGSATATISGVTVSDTAKFEITGTVVNTVNAGDTDVIIRSVQPKLGLMRGTYTATITVTYNGGTTASTPVTFTVTNPGARYTQRNRAYICRRNGRIRPTCSPACHYHKQRRLNGGYQRCYRVPEYGVYSCQYRPRHNHGGRRKHHNQLDSAAKTLTCGGTIYGSNYCNV